MSQDVQIFGMILGALMGITVALALIFLMGVIVWGIVDIVKSMIALCKGDPRES